MCEVRGFGEVRVGGKLVEVGEKERGETGDGDVRGEKEGQRMIVVDL